MGLDELCCSAVPVGLSSVYKMRDRVWLRAESLQEREPHEGRATENKNIGRSQRIEALRRFHILIFCVLVFEPNLDTKKVRGFGVLGG